MHEKRADVVKGQSIGPPRFVTWNNTLRCSLKCSHCYVKAGENETAGVLSADEALAVIDQIRDVGTPVVVLSGGESLLRSDICEIARYGTEVGLQQPAGTGPS